VALVRMAQPLSRRWVRAGSEGSSCSAPAGTRCTAVLGQSEGGHSVPFRKDPWQEDDATTNQPTCTNRGRCRSGSAFGGCSRHGPEPSRAAGGGAKGKEETTHHNANVPEEGVRNAPQESRGREAGAETHLHRSGLGCGSEFLETCTTEQQRTIHSRSVARTASLGLTFKQGASKMQSAASSPVTP
jgi:hypothetical protein